MCLTCCSHGPESGGPGQESKSGTEEGKSGWCCFGFKFGEIREDFLELVFSSLGTLSALCRGDGGFREHGSQLWRGAKMGTLSASVVPGVPGRKGGRFK